MTSSRASHFALGGLVILMVGLFAAIYSLNIRQYRASQAVVENAVERTLAISVEQMIESMLFEEIEIISRAPLDRIPTAPVFVLLYGEFTPVCMVPYTRGKVSEKDAAEAFGKGVELLPSPDAENCFLTAAAGPSNTPAAMYRKISALFNLMERSDDPALVCSTVALLDDGKLSAAQTAFFTTMLAEQVEELPRIRDELTKRRAEANQLNQLRLIEAPPFRQMVDGRMLSVLEDGHAVFRVLDLEALPFGEWSRKSTARSLELCPGLYAVADDQVIEHEKSRIKQQYDRGNVVLSLMVLLASFLVGGIIAAMIRQQKLDAVRTQFIATVSHELRTPLSLIRLHAETLHHGRIPVEKVADYHQTILTESERLTGIVNNVLDFSRMERGKMSINLEPVNLSDCTTRIVDSFRFRFESDGFEVARNIAPHTVAMADPLAWSQILFNLLDNAVKYSDDMKMIGIELETTGDRVILRVSDSGIGIPDKLKRTIFDDFVRSGDAKVTARRGSGIGLSVARKLIEKMGGTVAVADNVPKGSVFTVSVPSASSGQQGRQDGGDTTGGIYETAGG